jgi:hypothetical protein
MVLKLNRSVPSADYELRRIGANNRAGFEWNGSIKQTARRRSRLRV